MRIEHAGGAVKAQLTSDLGGTSGDLAIICDALTNWPTGAIGPFYATIDRGLATQEKILCSVRASNTLTVWTDGLGGTGRGADGTSVQTHLTGAYIEHVWTGVEADAANAHEENDAIHVPTGDETVTICTSATRPGSPAANQIIFETDTSKMFAYVNSAWVQIESTQVGSGYADLFLLMGA